MDKGSFSSNTVEKSMQITEDAIYAAVKTLEDLENPVKNIQWTTCKDFTVDLGRQQIEEYISRREQSLRERRWPGQGHMIKKCQGHISYRQVNCFFQYQNSIHLTWEFHESWLHWSDYLEKEDLEFSVRYHYRVRWSIPTSRKPIPRATACVYFLIEISKIKPKSLPVEVFFVLESNRYVHRPGKSRFREKWLKDIIESKIILMNSINF